MPDNRYDEMDGPFIDQAWEDMRARLDREMPVRKDDRRWLWLLLLLLLGAAVGLGGWWYLQRPPKTEPLPAERDPVATREEPGTVQSPRLDESISSAAVGTAKNDEKTADKTLEKESPETTSGSGLFAGKAKGGSIDPPVAFVDKRREPAGQDDALAPLASQLREPEPLESSLRPAGPSLAVPLSMAPENAGDRPAPAPFERLAKRPAPALSSAGFSLEPEIIQPVGRSRFRFGLESAVLAETRDFTGGWSAGLTARYQPVRGRWGAVAGLNLQQIGSRSLFEESDVAFAESDITSPEFVDTSIVSNAGSIEGRYLAELESTTYLTLPLQAVYRLNRQFRLEAGVQLAWLLAHRQTARYEFDLYDQGSFNQDTPRQSVSLTDSAYESQPVNRLDVALSGGIGFYPGDRWGIRAHYNHGLVRTLESDAGRVYNRQVRLSLSYFINR